MSPNNGYTASCLWLFHLSSGITREAITGSLVGHWVVARHCSLLYNWWRLYWGQNVLLTWKQCTTCFLCSRIHPLPLSIPLWTACPSLAWHTSVPMHLIYCRREQCGTFDSVKALACAGLQSIWGRHSLLSRAGQLMCTINIRCYIKWPFHLRFYFRW